MTSVLLHTISGRLQLDTVQQAAIEMTLEAFKAACAEAVSVGQRLDTTSNAVIHRSCYRDLRTAFGLSANLTIRAIAQAARQLKNLPDTNEDLPAIDYDARTLSLSDDLQTVSLSTVDGRMAEVPFLLAASEQRLFLQTAGVHRAMLRRVQANTYLLDVTLALKGSSASGFSSEQPIRHHKK